MKTRLLLLFLVVFSFANSQVTNGLLYSFSFDNTFSSDSGNNTFYAPNVLSPLTYGVDRFGISNKAVVVSTNSQATTILPNIPMGSSARSISVWMKPTSVNADNIIFTYGSTASCAYTFGGSFGLSNVYNFNICSGGNNAATNTVAANVWKHIVITHSGTVSKIYINGTLSATSNLAINTVSSSVDKYFYLGSYFNGSAASFSGSFDDLKIYNREITASEVTELYGGNAAISGHLIAEYNFNNTYGDTNGNNPFNGIVGASSTNDRHTTNNNPIGALRLNQVGISATIPNLPKGSLPRTVSIWYKVEGATTDNTLFVYGASGGESAYGVSFGNTGTWYNFAWNTNTPFTNSSSDGLWHHLVTTFDQNKTSRVYVDGVLKSTAVQSGWNTADDNTFWLGGLFSSSGSNFNGTVDDLKIYDYALSQSEITSLYTNNTLASPDFSQNNLQISLYPNPVKDILHIETAGEIKAVTVYGILGNQVMTSTAKEINVSNLSKGTYIVKIQDTNNAVSTKKFIKE